jgi:glycosyltransferase involved in cell wall biosynthesis
MDPPLVSCICPTYNRPPHYQHLLEEAIESFLRQDYPNKELIVLNDAPGQELHCDAPGVTIVNASSRYPTLGEKCNAAVRLSRGELIAPWDDDDISLPWRLSLSAERLGDADYFNPRAYWMLWGDRLADDHRMGYAHNASLFTRAAFERVGGYRAISNGYDRDIDLAFRTELERGVDPWYRGSPELSKREWFYIYRWGVSPSHVSSRAEDDQGRYAEIGEQPITDGCFILTPGWRKNYAEEIRRRQSSLSIAGLARRFRSLVRPSND